MARTSPQLAADILVWAEPMARDGLRAFWDRVAPDPDSARAMADLQWRIWRFALSALPHGAAASRRELTKLVQIAGLSMATIEQGDETVIDEIAEVIVARFRRSPATAKDYTKALIMTAAGLIGARDRAAA